MIAKNPVGRTLVVVPNRLIRQWEDEIEHRTELAYFLYAGPLRYRYARQLKKEDIIILTTYDVVKQEGRRSFQPEVCPPASSRPDWSDRTPQPGTTP